MGQAGIAAAAAYGVAYATVRGHDVVIQVGLALVVAVVVSAIYAVMTMRSRGIVFLMITLALGMMVFGLAFKLASVTGGQNGLTDIDRPALIAESWRFYLVCAAAFVTGSLLLRHVSRSPFGLALRGVRESESRMSSLGYRVAAIKFGAVMIAGLVAGAAGSSRSGRPSSSARRSRSSRGRRSRSSSSSSEAPAPFSGPSSVRPSSSAPSTG